MTKRGRTLQYWYSLMTAFLLLAGFHHLSQAHEIRPAIIDLKIGEKGHIRLTQQVNLETLLAGIGSEHLDTDQSKQAADYNRLRLLPPAQLEELFTIFQPRMLAGTQLLADGRKIALEVVAVGIPEVGDSDLARTSIIELQALLPAGSNNLSWHWDAAFGSNVLRVDSNTGDELYTAYLQPGQISAPIPLSSKLTQSGTVLFLDYLGIGFAHILPKGSDHILFVIGLFLLNARLSALLWQVSSFTLAHTLTLALGIYGIVQIPATIVEPLIAASIVYVCVENLYCDHLTRWRPVVVFVFGLLHGLGFAGVLKEIGLAPEHFITGLVAFNIGVELGQLSVIAGCFVLVGLWFSNRVWYRHFITLPASLVIALIGSYWFIERIGLD
ncbi:MAG: HupE/UreJ family protein [Gammaproteobacteria bacterium]|nr:HupE/UreJ family protein [Gammaproteobacteria bacterium]